MHVVDQLQMSQYPLTVAGAKEPRVGQPALERGKRCLDTRHQQAVQVDVRDVILIVIILQREPAVRRPATCSGRPALLAANVQPANCIYLRSLLLTIGCCCLNF